MSLLTNLLEFSNFQPSSLLFCESPKELNLDKNTKELRTLMSARKEQTITPEKRIASKSLTKLDLLSLSNTKIDPKDRLLHRMVHKINMKCRKHYYNFFVVLENLKKQNISLYSAHKGKTPQYSAIQNGVAKLTQLEQILFSKYFSTSMKKSAFQSISRWSLDKTGFIKLIKTINKKYICGGFKAIQQFSKKAQKEQIRMDILVDSIHHIDRSITNFHRIMYLQTAMSCLKANYANYIKRPKDIEKAYEQFKTPAKGKNEPQVVEFKPFPAAYSPFSKQKTSNLNNSIQNSYQNLKTRKKLNEQSPGKPRQPIEVACEEVKLKIDKCFNYLKNSKCKTNLNEQTISGKFSREPIFQISKRCEPIILNCHEVPDLNDKGTIFFDQLFSNIPIIRSCDISESSVKYFHKKDSISESFSEELHSTSQVSLITPLTQKTYESPKKNISASGVRGGAFGSEAVNFKNSLVFERQLMKDQQGQERVRERKQCNFAKIKNQVKNEKKAHDEYQQSQSRFKLESRYDSSQRDYNLLKLRRESDFSINIPQGMVSQSANATARQAPYIKRSSQTPQPDIRSNYTSQRKHLSLMNNNKIQIVQDDGKRNAGATYLKILSKR